MVSEKFVASFNPVDRQANVFSEGLQQQQQQSSIFRSKCGVTLSE